jgi:NAD(P)-dependent dehydrogenase (short-subunit alcohol dehydrogenase family)
LDLVDAIVVVTGGNGAMGPAIAARLRAIGATPVTWDIYSHGNQDAVTCDVADAKSVSSAMQQTVDGWGVPTAIVNAAAISGGYSPLAVQAESDWDRVLTAPEDWTRVLATNVIGVANCMRAFAQRLAQIHKPGAIVNISSIGAGPVAEAGLAAYAASKAAVNQLTRIAAVDLGPLGIRVNAVGAGVMASPMLGPNRSPGVEPLVARSPGYVADITRYVPIEQRHGRGEDIAEAVCAVLQTGWITGQIIYADGGLTLRSQVTT